jgi:hypothetical protein
MKINLGKLLKGAVKVVKENPEIARWSRRRNRFPRGA